MTSLRHAKAIWAQLSRYLVTSDDATAGTHSLRRAKFSSKCNDGELKGSVFRKIHHSFRFSLHRRSRISRRCRNNNRLVEGIQRARGTLRHLMTLIILRWMQKLLRTSNISRLLPSEPRTKRFQVLSWRKRHTHLCQIKISNRRSLSAHLYEQTFDEEYLSAAVLSATFISDQLYNGVVILDTIDLGTCTRSMLLKTYNSGLTIDGLSVLAGLNRSYIPLYVLSDCEGFALAGDFLPVFS